MLQEHNETKLKTLSAQKAHKANKEKLTFPFHLPLQMSKVVSEVIFLFTGIKAYNFGLGLLILML